MAKVVTIKQLKNYWPLYLFVVPSILLVGLFAYYPAINAMYHAFYRWNGHYVNNFIGFANFQRLLGTPTYWVIAVLVLAAVIANGRKTNIAATIAKLAAGILAPLINIVVLSPSESFTPEWSRLWPSSVIWGALFLGCHIFMKRDNDGRPACLMALFAFLATRIFITLGLTSNYAWSLVALIIGVWFWLAPLFKKSVSLIQPLRTIQALIAIGILLWSLALHAGGDSIFWSGFSVIGILVVANIIKMIPSIATAVVIHRLKSDTANYWYRVLFVVPMIIPGMVYLLIWKFFFEPERVLNIFLNHTGIMSLLVKMDTVFQWGGIFVTGQNPAWLNDTNLVLPAIIIWGFPWVGVVGVLIYLAGLQSIDKSVYEASNLDGVTPLGQFFHIELPLILTQVRINLVLMIIGTLQMYPFILILFGIEGGPNGKLMVPGLYMFREAFVSRYTGYACCIGLVLFVFILILTELNNRFIRIDK